MTATIAPFSRPLYVMLKPIGAHCNMACKYCYYLEKAKLYDQVPRHVMTDEMLERFVREYIEPADFSLRGTGERRLCGRCRFIGGR